MSDEKERVILKNLRDIMGDNADIEIVQYIMSIQSEEDFEEFMGSIGKENIQAATAYKNLKRELFSNKSSPPKQNNQTKPFGSGGKSKKTKYTSIYDQETASLLRKGRHPCNCEATKHELVNNCLNCGRIVCKQEGSGPCFFCDTMVCSRNEMEILKQQNKESSKLYNQLTEQKLSKEWKQAIEHRNKLIEKDKLGIRKTRIIDDQNDYYDVNTKWMDEAELEAAQLATKKRYDLLHKSRREFKLALDFASRTAVVTDDKNVNKQELLKGVNKLLDSAEHRFPRNLFDGDKGELISELVNMMEEVDISKTSKAKNESIPRKKLIVANAEFLESVDQGMCLSMHQPWASLLVSGIKIHEGRTWKTEHRGRLWIAAAAKEPEDDDILSCEEMYRTLYNDPTIKFPNKYPIKCLLGCVNVDDCLDQKTYRERFGEDAESDSPFVLICSNPVVLPIFYPMQGQHKIFALTSDLHRTAKAALMSSKWF